MKVFIVAGDPSGDAHASHLMRELRRRVPDVEFLGIGGSRMADAGLRSLVSIDTMSVTGFWEVMRRYPYFKSVLRGCIDELNDWKPHVFVPVDYPGFNMALAASAKKSHVPVAWYIAPQLWAWGRSRAKKFSRVVDELLVVFPFEVEFFSEYGITTRFVGHPTLDDESFQSLSPPLEGRAHQVAFLPGSRAQEIHRHLPIFEKTAALLRQSQPLLRCTIARSAHVPPEMYASISRNSIFDFSDNSKQLMRTASVGVIKTGTSTLEAALCGLPFSMVYKTSIASYVIGRSLVSLPNICLVNILSGRQVVREFVQQDAKPERIAEETLQLLNDHSRAQSMYTDLVALRNVLGSSGASSRTAEHIVRIAGYSEKGIG